MTRRHNHSAQVVTSFVRIPAELEDGKARCNGCSKVVAVTKVGRTRLHNTPAGEPCAYEVVYGAPVELDELPEVSFAKRDQWVERSPDEPSRLDVGSACEDCDKWLPGERHVCGQCAIKRERARHKKPRAG